MRINISYFSTVWLPGLIFLTASYDWWDFFIICMGDSNSAWKSLSSWLNNPPLDTVVIHVQLSYKVWSTSISDKLVNSLLVYMFYYARVLTLPTSSYSGSSRPERTERWTRSTRIRWPARSKGTPQLINGLCILPVHVPCVAGSITSFYFMHCDKSPNTLFVAQFGVIFELLHT